MRRSIAYILICTLLSSACATATQPAKQQKAKPANIKEWVDQQSRAKKQAVIGALAGALLGAASAKLTGNDPLKGALAGALVGAVAGFASGKHQDRIFAERDLAVSQANYQSSQGYVAKVERVAFDPEQPKPGQTAKLYVRYTVIGPDPNEPITVKMFRGLKYGDDYVMGAGPNEFVIPRGGGIVDSTMEVTLPKKAPQGTYSIEALIEDPKGRFPTAIGTGPLYVVAAFHEPHAVTTVASR